MKNPIIVISIILMLNCIGCGSSKEDLDKNNLVENSKPTFVMPNSTVNTHTVVDEIIRQVSLVPGLQDPANWQAYENILQPKISFHLVCSIPNISNKFFLIRYNQVGQLPCHKGLWLAVYQNLWYPQ